ncbi:hypothetical protein MKZ38_005201 [Zalerion maritima]|uniref:Uncharacterized protein n=1 Tax=Zalerion maritima TaxID=339359 RepID=A0AAD5RWB2_9PEZI|nr:hypothetical protein MKZ38_005201 [Zalerion maritima]
MSPTYTMSHHLWSQIYSSWRQTRQTSPDLSSPTSTTTATTSYFQRSTSPKRSMDSDRSDSPPASSSIASSTSRSPGWKGR